LPRFSANFRSAIAAGGLFVPLVRIAWPSGTKHYGVWPMGIGGYAIDPRLLAGAVVSNALPLHPGSLSFPESSVTLADSDGAVSRLLYGGTEVRGVACSLIWAIRDLDEADWYTHLVGILDRSSSGDGGYSQTLHIRANDTPLQGNTPKATFLPAEFGDALPPTWNTFIPILYGSHSAADLTSKGMVVAINWSYDAVEGYRYSPMLGVAKGVPRVYINGVLATITTDYVISYPIRGKQITSIDLVADPGADAIITCDIDGIEDVGDGTGELIVNPVAQLRHYLANFAFGDWRHGAWNSPEDHPIDLPTFAESESFADAFGFAGSMRFGGDADAQKIADVLQQFFSSWPCFRPFWSEDGKISIRPIDHRYAGHTSPGFTSDIVAVFLRARAQEIGVSFDQAEDTSHLVRRIDGQALFGVDEGGQGRKGYQSVSVEDVAQPDDVAARYVLDFSESRLV